MCQIKIRDKSAVESACMWYYKTVLVVKASKIKEGKVHSR